jgi:hypothetical protein
MPRKRLAWLLCSPLLLAGTEAGHWLAYRIVYPNAWQRAQALAQSGHGYLAYWPAFGGVAFATLLTAVLLEVREQARGSADDAPAQPSALVFAALPPLTFALQEHLESLVHNGSISGVVEAPTFMVGVALQLPFALAAFLLARGLLRVAEVVGRALRAPAPRATAPVEPAHAHTIAAPRPLQPLGARTARGPPLTC